MKKTKEPSKKALPRRAPLPRRTEVPKPKPHGEAGDQAESKGAAAARSAAPPRPSSDVPRMCRSCGIYHCFTCDKCMSGLEPYDQHMKSDRHVKKLCDQKLLEKIENERKRLGEVSPGKEAVAPDSSGKISVSKVSPRKVTPESEKWKRWFSTSCPHPTCAYHCAICDFHVAEKSSAEEHAVSQEHEARVNASRNVAMRPLATSVATETVKNVSRSDEKTKARESGETIVMETESDSMKNLTKSREKESTIATDSVASVVMDNGAVVKAQKVSLATRSVAMATEPLPFETEVPPSTSKDGTEFSDDLVAPAKVLFPSTKPVSKSFSEGIVVRPDPPSPEHWEPEDRPEPEYPEDSFDQFDFERGSLLMPEGVSRTPFADLKKSSNVDALSENLDSGMRLRGTKTVKSEMSDDAEFVISDSRLDTEVKTVDQRKSEDLSLFEPGNSLFDISIEPDIAPKKTGRMKPKPDYEWCEDGVQVDTQDLKKSETEIQKQEAEKLEAEKSWESFFQETTPPKPTEEEEARKLLLNPTRFSPFSDNSSMKLPTKPSNSPEIVMIHSNCRHPGCVFHCEPCDAHLSGHEPRLQHEHSATHRKIIENSQRLQKEEKCTFPGCAFHCQVCDLHLTGVGPRDQHLLSSKHIKKARAMGVKVNESPPRAQVGQSLPISPGAMPDLLSGSSDSPPMGASGSCGLSFCFHHCFVCNLHFTDDASRKLHLQSRKHWELAQRSLPNTASQARSVPVSKTMAMARDEDINLNSVDCFKDPCPDNHASCFFHCKACDKHCCGVQPKVQHEKSEKHLKAVMRWIKAGGQPAPVVDTTDGITEGQPSMGKDLLLPDRSDLPLVKAGQENDLDPEFRTRDQPRDYQREVFLKARDHDAICYMPTGTGKTLVSAMLIEFMLDRNPWKPVLFIVDKVLLVLQQTQYLREQIGERQFKRYGVTRRVNVAGKCGGKLDMAGARPEEVDVIVATAGVIENDIKAKKMRWLDFSMIVMDEIHHCEKNHPYKRLIEGYHDKAPYDKRPKIFGMTASPGAEMTTEASLARLRNLLRAVGNAKLCRVENSLAELSHHQSESELKFIHVELTDAEKKLQAALRKHLLQCYRFLKSRSDIHSFGIIELRDNRPDIHNELEFEKEKLVNIRNCLELVTAKPTETFHVKNVLEHMYVVCSGLMGLTICGDIAAYHVLRELLDQQSAKGFKSMFGLGIKSQDLVYMISSNCNQLQVKDYILSAIEQGQSMSAYDKLMSIILKEVNWSSREQGKQPIVLILVKERKTAQFLTEILESNQCLKRENIRVTSLVGHGGKGPGDGMTVAKQTRVLGGIRDYLYQLIVATSVAEEGLDLPSCDIVIEMDAPSGITSLVQIRGRARQKESRLFALCSDNSTEIQIRRLLLHERCMYDAIDIICQEQDIGLDVCAVDEIPD